MTAQEVNYPSSVKVVKTKERLKLEPFSVRQNVVLMERRLPSGFNHLAAVLQTEAYKVLGPVDSFSTSEYDDYPYMEWDCVNRVLESQDPELKDAIDFLKCDIEFIPKARLRVQWKAAGTEDEGFHTDGILLRDSRVGRFVTIYDGLATRGKDITTGSEFAFHLGDLWRHACDPEGGNFDEVSPFEHKATKSDQLRILMVGG